MNRAFSIYLDLVRFGAACLVYLYHSNQRWLITDKLPFSNYGHTSVIVFFVLSGYVIAHVTERKENDWVSYSASRASRVYSVVLPALVLTLVLDAVGRHLLPDVYSGYPFDQLLVRSLASLLMLNEVWFVSITTLSNVPYWSITYEFWYYVLFGLVTFLPGRVGLVAAGLLLLALGPKIALLAPLWIAGVVLQRWKALARLPEWASWLLVVSSLAGLVGLHVAEFPEAANAWLQSWLGVALHKQLTFSKFFVGDYLIGALVFANFAGMMAVAERLKSLFLKVETPVRFLAGYTFTLYLLHQPLFLFWGAALQGDPKGSGAWWFVTGLTVLSIGLIGHFTEHRRHRFRVALVGLFQRLGSARPQGRGA